MRNFNPRPREEGDFSNTDFTDIVRISIHALVKRATIPMLSSIHLVPISIHALVKRATVYGAVMKREIGISIHALVKRATEIVNEPENIDMHFNPRPREEGDNR